MLKLKFITNLLQIYYKLQRLKQSYHYYKLVLISFYPIHNFFQFFLKNLSKISIFFNVL